jgi:hypothetical protein
VPQATKRVAPMWVLRLRVYKAARTIRQGQKLRKYEVLLLKLQMYRPCVSISLMITNLIIFQPKDGNKKDTPFTPKTMRNIVVDLCSFIMREVIPTVGDHFDPEGELASDRYRVLTDIAALKLSHGDL